MSLKRLSFLFGLALFGVQGLTAPRAYAVGDGVSFGFRETPIPGAAANVVFANSLDFTYHACTDFTAPGVFTERGYLWISSFQDVDSVVDSQINHFAANGYHIYARYDYDGEECASHDMCTAGKIRKTYEVEQASIQLFLDPLQDTAITLNNCAVQVANNADDVPLGAANAILEGQKTETDDIINGDFEIVFGNWAFSASGMSLFRDLNGNALAVPTLVLNGNVTRLRGPLENDHRPEGSGNLFWRD